MDLKQLILHSPFHLQSRTESVYSFSAMCRVTLPYRTASQKQLGRYKLHCFHVFFCKISFHIRQPLAKLQSSFWSHPVCCKLQHPIDDVTHVYKEPFLVEVFVVLLLFIICWIWSTHFDSELGRFVGKSWGMAHGQPTSAVRALQLELKKINDEPVEGFQVRLANDDNIFEWQVAIFGPPGTLYEGGYFKVTFVYFRGFSCTRLLCILQAGVHCCWHCYINTGSCKW